MNMSEKRVLYIVNGSIASWRVLLALHEKGLSFATKRVRVMRAEPETRTPEFLALNPRGQVPLLVDPKPSLLPPQENKQEYANAIAWIQEAETFACAYEPLEYLFLKKSSDMNEDRKTAIKTALTAINFDLNLWEARASKHTFIVSKSFTLADCSVYPTIAYMMHRGLKLDGFPNLIKYEQRIRLRPSAQFAHPEGWGYDRTSKPNLFQLAELL
jgi:glutathione S-transferase